MAMMLLSTHHHRHHHRHHEHHNHIHHLDHHCHHHHHHRHGRYHHADNDGHGGNAGGDDDDDDDGGNDSDFDTPSSEYDYFLSCLTTAVAGTRLPTSIARPPSSSGAIQLKSASHSAGFGLVCHAVLQ